VTLEVRAPDLWLSPTVYRPRRRVE
jgi:hypothetical protein